MSHELSITGDGKVEMAYLESDGKCWHGLGTPLPDNASREDWGQATNFDNWSIMEAASLFFIPEKEEVSVYEKEKILYRSDSKLPLAAVGVGYQVVQPKQVLDFFNNLIEALGYKMCSAGILFSGRRYWAQAYIGTEGYVGADDMVRDKILLSTACDASLATLVQRVAERVVCNNTLKIAINEKGDRVRTTHAVQFDPDKVKTLLGINPEIFVGWTETAQLMTQVAMPETDAMDYFGRVFSLYEDMEETKDQDAITAQLERVALAQNSKTAEACFDLFSGAGLGSQLYSAKNTLWGAVNAVTEYVDHRRNTKTVDARIDSAYFGPFGRVKDRAWDEAVLMVR